MQEKKKKFLPFAPLRKRNGDEKMNFRTDLALEVRENLEGSRIDGVECTSFESAGAEITRLRVTDRRGEEILGKPRGEYITVQSQSFARSSRISDELIDAVAQELGIAEVHSELLPEDKVTQVERLLGEGAPGKYLAFVGDGINDAPVLARADLGAAMGGIGSDAAIEAADIVLMDDDPRKLSLAMRISRKTMRLVWQNIVFALAVKAVCLVLGALGIANMWVAIFADVGVMVLCVLNAARALDTKRL